MLEWLVDRFFRILCFVPTCALLIGIYVSFEKERIEKQVRDSKERQERRFRGQKELAEYRRKQEEYLKQRKQEREREWNMRLTVMKETRELEARLKRQKQEEKDRQILSSGIATLDKMEGHEFEFYCAALLRKLKFSKVEVTKGSGDQGVDIIAVKDGKKYAIQCKRYSSPLGNTPIQQVSAGMQFYHCQIAAVMTNQYFTSGAKQLAKATGVLLWDRDELIRMINSSKATTQ